MLLVTCNVRLGILGFATLEALRSRDAVRGSTGNYGMLDQRASVSDNSVTPFQGGDYYQESARGH